MPLELDLAADPPTVEAARSAVARVGALPARPGAEGRSPWWRAGLADSLRDGLVGPQPSRRYDVAPSPRRRRGATRA